MSSVIAVVIALLAAAFASVRTAEPAVALFLLAAVIIAAAIRPICGLYAIVFLTLVGDYFTAPWYPFVRNLSMRESVLFLSDQLTFSPLEVVVGATLAFWIVDVIFTPGARVVTGPLLAPLIAFTGFVAFGFLYGVGRGGDLRVALFEGRAMFLMLPIYVLAINLCNQTQLRRLVWTAVAAIFFNALLALDYLSGLSPAEQEMRQDLGEHSASIHFGFLFALTLILFLYRSGSRLTRYLLLGLCVPVLIVFLQAERRSAVVGLAMGVILIMASLWWRNRFKFVLVVPLLTIATIGYSVAFWNSTSTLGFPAEAIKTVVAPDSATEDDRNSSLYRTIENANLNYTIRTAPLTGLGFGQKFYRPYPLPDISFFALYEYIPHNSIIWVWIKTGFLGFFSMLLLIALAVREGVTQVVTLRDPMLATMAMVGVANIAMYAVYAFVDIAWDPRSMIVLGLSFALCAVGYVRPERAQPV